MSQLLTKVRRWAMWLEMAVILCATVSLGVIARAQLPTQSTGHLVTAAEYNAIINGLNAIQNQIVYFNASSCPSGWTEFTDARGRYIVGLVAGGTVDTGIGTALSNQEDRTHTHSVPGLSVPGLSVPGLTYSTTTSTNGSHTHPFSISTNTGSATSAQYGTVVGPGDGNGTAHVHSFSYTGDTDAGASAHSHTAAGTTDGGTSGTGTTGTGTSGTQSVTIAPYIQLIMCKKSLF